MNENAKKALLVAVIVVAVAVVAVMGMNSLGDQKLEKGVTHPSPPKSMAQMEREATARELAGRQAEQSDDAASGRGKAGDR